MHGKRTQAGCARRRRGRLPGPRGRVEDSSLRGRRAGTIGDTAVTDRAEALKRQRAQARARARAVASVVRDYYNNLDAKRLEAAWARLLSAVQVQLGGYDTWAAGREGTVEVTVTSLHPETASKTSASVVVALRSTSVDICSRTVHQRFTGTWTLGRTGGRWIATNLHIEKTGGGTERTDYAECDNGAGSSTSPTSSSAGEPDYVPADPAEPEPTPEDDPGFCDTRLHPPTSTTAMARSCSVPTARTHTRAASKAPAPTMGDRMSGATMASPSQGTGCPHALADQRWPSAASSRTARGRGGGRRSLRRRVTPTICCRPRSDARTEPFAVLLMAPSASTPSRGPLWAC
jgi:hypothetical protein